MVRIGLTGLMASGKSTVARRFQERGAELVDGDAIGWEVLRRPQVRDAIRGRFGDSAIDASGEVDRVRLGRIVFGDPEAMDRLNAIVQPLVLARVREIVDATGDGVRVIDAALLTTWRLEPELDGVVEVVAPKDVRIRRLRVARGFSDAEARERVDGQKLPPVRGARRHWRIENEGDLTELNRRSDAVWAGIEALARPIRPE